MANSIVKAIETSRETRVIGILGPWGSGKSTIVKLVEKKLGDTEQSIMKTYFFSYDAWLHQNDPPRRSFLETLVRFLVSKNLTSYERWTPDLDRLNRNTEDKDVTTTPTLTWPGTLVAVSLFATAFGWKLADSTRIDIFGYWFPVSLFGYFLISTPLLAAAASYFALKKNNDGTTVFSIFVNKAIERVKTTTIKTPDPTAIEFQDFFRRLMASVTVENRSFVFVIDNLDRITETEAIAIWSTIRSFFVNELKLGTNEQAAEAAPVVLLPLDPTAIHRMYGKTSPEAEELAQSFIDKTFDLVFRVNPPVQSGWQSYLEKLLHETFESLTDHDTFIATKLYETWIVENSRGVTPRNINILVNDLAVLYLQWRTEIPFSTIAYYAVNRPNIEKSFQKHLSQTAPYISRFDYQWAEGIAATLWRTTRSRLASTAFAEAQ